MARAPFPEGPYHIVVTDVAPHTTQTGIRVWMVEMTLIGTDHCWHAYIGNTPKAHPIWKTLVPTWEDIPTLVNKEYIVLVGRVTSTRSEKKVVNKVNEFICQVLK